MSTPAPVPDDSTASAASESSPSAPVGRRSGRLRRPGVGCMAVLVLLAVVFALGPRVEVDPEVAASTVPDQPQAVPQWVAEHESAVDDLIPGAESRIRWIDGEPGRTPVSLVYFHGFSASPPEISPVVETVADELGANAYFPRQTAHGRESASGFATATVNDWLQDAVDALAVGRAIGERVILVGLSTGGLYPVWLALHDDERVAALVLLSPNFGLRDKRSEMMRWPWGEQIVRGITGDEHEFRTINELHARYWTERYPVEGLLQMMALVDHVRSAPLEQVTVPTLLVWTPNDRICEPADMKAAFARLGSADKELWEFAEATGHILAGDILYPDRNPALIERLVEFLQPRVAPTPGDD